MTGDLSNNGKWKVLEMRPHKYDGYFTSLILTDFSLRTLEMNFKKHLWNVIKGFRSE